MIDAPCWALQDRDSEPEVTVVNSSFTHYGVRAGRICNVIVLPQLLSLSLFPPKHTTGRSPTSSLLLSQPSSLSSTEL